MTINFVNTENNILANKQILLQACYLLSGSIDDVMSRS